MIASLFDSIPFEQHRIVDTADIDEARHQIGQILNSYQLQVIRGRILHSRLELVPCGHLVLLRSRHGYGADISIDPDCQSLDGYYLLVLPIQGTATFYFDRQQIAASPNKAFILSPNRRLYFTTSHDYEQILLRLDGSTLAAAWQRMTAQEHVPDICFDPIIPLHTTSWQALMPMLQWVVRCAGHARQQNTIDAALLAETGMLVATTLLMHQPHSMAVHLWPAPPPRVAQAVERARSYMLEHLGQRLSVSMIASHCGLSVRRLQALFQDEFGQSPLQWQRQQRLQGVRRLLLQDNAAHSITDVATRYGFTHLGDFSQAYRRAFGETPVQTRRNAGRHYLVSTMASTPQKPA